RRSGKTQSERGTPRSDFFVRELARRSGALQPLVAFAVIAAALLDPLQPAIAVGCLVGIVLVEAGVHAGLARRLLGIFGTDRARIDGIAGRDRCRCGRRRRLGSGRGSRRWRGRRARRSGGVRTALRLAEVVPFHGAERASVLGGFVLGAALG